MLILSKFYKQSIYKTTSDCKLVFDSKTSEDKKKIGMIKSHCIVEL